MVQGAPPRRGCARPPAASPPFFPVLTGQVSSPPRTKWTRRGRGRPGRSRRGGRGGVQAGPPRGGGPRGRAGGGGGGGGAGGGGGGARRAEVWRGGRDRDAAGGVREAARAPADGDFPVQQRPARRHLRPGHPVGRMLPCWLDRAGDARTCWPGGRSWLAGPPPPGPRFTAVRAPSGFASKRRVVNEPGWDVCGCAVGSRGVETSQAACC
jgi:hypothetical protein